MNSITFINRQGSVKRRRFYNSPGYTKSVKTCHLVTNWKQQYFIRLGFNYIFIKFWYINTYHSLLSQCHLSQYFFLLLYRAVILKLVVICLSGPLRRHNELPVNTKKQQPKNNGLNNVSYLQDLWLWILISIQNISFLISRLK